MTDISADRPAWSWDEMLASFRSLGGEAQNIALGNGRYGRGLFPLDPTVPVLVRIPPNLLIPVKDIEFLCGNVRVRQSAAVPEAEREFLERYEDAFSWGGGGEAESAAYIASLDALPPEIRELLIAEFHFADRLEGDFAQRVQNHFLRSREIAWKDEAAIMPIIELANHDARGLPYQRGADLRIEGPVRDEVLVSYGPQDAFSILHSFGFVNYQPSAFSLPTRATLGEFEIAIGRNTDAARKRGAIRVPNMKVAGRNIGLSYVVLGNQRFPRLPRGILRTLLHEAGVDNPDEVFDDIRRYNELKFIKLLRTLEPYEGEMIAKLRTMARHQLDAMTHCIGSRKLDPAPATAGT